jgi:hypothetical protein
MVFVGDYPAHSPPAIEQYLSIAFPPPFELVASSKFFFVGHGTVKSARMRLISPFSCKIDQ